MAYACRILADSMNPAGNRLTTFEVTFPRIVLAEFNTHRMLSRNSSSSRAIPVEKRIAMVEADPFVPDVFGRNQRGMQAGEALDGEAALVAETEWLQAARSAVEHARSLAELGVHKQLANRLIEPFCWHTCIVTATEWENFYALRCHPAAQPEIRRIAEMMREAMAAKLPAPIDTGAWHLPLVSDEDRAAVTMWGTVALVKVSAGRCARVSYLTHDGKRDPQADLDLCDRLAASGHMSPLEHPAQALDTPERHGNLIGWRSLRAMTPGEAVFRG